MSNPLIMTVYGTRPEAIKVAPVIKAIEASGLLRSMTVVTGQHREMLDEVNAIFGITPDADLDIMRHGQTLSEIAAKVLSGLDPLLAAHRPAAVIVQGDTTTSTAAALAAFYRGIPVVHVEAGLRSHNLMSPFPEEANRKLTSQVASLHLAPTHTSRENLLREGIAPETVVVTGNTVIDALLATIDRQIPFSDPRLETLSTSGRRVVLVTTHRRENWGEAMESVGRAVARIAESYPDLTVVFPIHRNPVVRDSVLPPLAGIENILVTEPLKYGEFTRLLGRSTLVLTDSGGVQEEAPSLGVPVLVMRENTERPEAVQAGTVLLIGTEEGRIVREVARLLDDGNHYRAMANAVNPYGDGAASRRTVAALTALLGRGDRIAEFSG